MQNAAVILGTCQIFETKQYVWVDQEIYFSLYLYIPEDLTFSAFQFSLFK